MATEAQILANRLNAEKSTGPTTPEGKAAVSQNALKHGLTAENDLISSEDLTEFEAFRDATIREYAPLTAVELMLAKELSASPGD